MPCWNYFPKLSREICRAGESVYLSDHTYLTLMLLLSVSSLTPYIPSTVLGLLGIVAYYLYLYFKKKNSNELKRIESVPEDQRVRALEVMANDHGIPLDTEGLNAEQKFHVIQLSLQNKMMIDFLVSVQKL